MITVVNTPELTREEELEMLSALMEPFGSKINVTLAALYTIAYELKLSLTWDGKTHFIEQLNIVDQKLNEKEQRIKVESHRVKMSKELNRLLKAGWKETEVYRRIQLMKNFIRRNFPKVAPLLKESKCKESDYQ